LKTKILFSAKRKARKGRIYSSFLIPPPPILLFFFSISLDFSLLFISLLRHQNLPNPNPEMVVTQLSLEGCVAGAFFYGSILLSFKMQLQFFFSLGT
jgi:hypothetical protein